MLVSQVKEGCYMSIREQVRVLCDSQGSQVFVNVSGYSGDIVSKLEPQ